MNKYTWIAVVALGGIILIPLVLPKNGEEATPMVAEETQTIQQDLQAQLITGIPVYPNSSVVSVQSSSGAESQDVSVSLSAEASISEVNDWYRKVLSTDGWSIKSDKNIGGYQIIQGEKDNLYTSLQVAKGSEAGHVIISQQMKIRQ